jgi:aryl-alcohol dehydrogenase-like predicted oxidoreductase
MMIIMAGNSRIRQLIGSSCRIGLGGEGVLRTEGREEDALAMLDSAYEAGIRYYDSAPAYAGSEGYYGRFWKQHPERKERTFQTSKSAQRSANGASEDLEKTLKRMGREHLGLWQIHDVRDKNDILLLEKAGGALRKFYQARESGIARGIGVTGHHNPKSFFMQSPTGILIQCFFLSIPLNLRSGDFLIGLSRRHGNEGSE